VSGNYGRISKIKERLSSIQVTLESDYHTRTEDLQRRLKSLEETMWSDQEQTSRKFAAVKETLSKLTQAQDEEKLAYDELLEEGSSSLVVMEDAAMDLMRRAAHARRDTEVRVVRTIEDCSLTAAQEIELLLRGDVARALDKTAETDSSQQTEVRRGSHETKSIVEVCEHLNSMVSQQLLSLDNRVKRLQTERSDLTAQVHNFIVEEASRLGEESANEAIAREEAENALLSLIREVTERVRTDLDKERSEREAAEESLLGLLEETCSKIKAFS
jgi:uncharacterized protein (UPF0335 family)